MALTMYAATVPLFDRMLNNLLGLLDKAEAYAAERKFDPNVLVSSRLAPDMYPLSFQIQSASDRTKFALSRLTGREAPSWPDEEKTLEELRARIRKAQDYLAEYSAEELDTTADRPVVMKLRGQEVTMSGQEYLLNYAYPNLFFHLTTAYNILRHNGVPVGKRDFTGI